MRDLSYGPYTHQQVLDRLHDPVVRITNRYDVLDESRQRVGKLTTVSTDPRAALVEHNIDGQGVPGSLDLTMASDEALRGFCYRRYIVPWQGFEMRDGGWVEYPWGQFVWTIPDREIPARGIEDWKLVLPDQCDLLNTQGPDENTGFTAFAGDNISAKVIEILSYVGITDFSGVQWSPITFDQTKTWLFQKPNTPDYQELDKIETSLRSAEGLARIMYEIRQAELNAAGVTPVTEGPVTWLSILTELHQSLSYWPPHFNWNGTYQAKTALDVTRIVPDQTLTYVSDLDSIMSDVSTRVDLGKFANKVVSKSENPDGLYAQVTVTLDDWMPGHPLCQRETHRSVPHYETETNVNDIGSLYAAAILRLFYMANTYDSEKFIHHVNPAHEPYDFIGVQVLDDPELARARGDSTFQAILQPVLDFLDVRLPVATVPVYQEHMLAVDLNTVDMDSGGYRVYLPLQGFG